MRMKINKVTKAVNKRLILNKVNLELFKDEITFIIGETASDNGVILNILGALDNPNSGDILIQLGNICIKLDERNNFRGKGLGFIFQEENLLRGLTVKENLIIGLGLSNGGFNKEYFQNTIEKFDIMHLLSKKVENLSCLEKQKVALSRAILSNGKIILADNPVANLKKVDKELLYQKYRSLKNKRIIIIMSNDYEMAKKYGDRIIKFINGEIDEDIRVSQYDVEEKTSNDYGCFLKTGHKHIAFFLGYKHFLGNIGSIICFIISLSFTQALLFFVLSLLLNLVFIIEIDIIIILLILVVPFFLITLFIQTNTFVKTKLYKIEYNIGLLKLLGVSGKQLFSVYIIEFTVILITSFCIGYSFYLLTFKLLITYLDLELVYMKPLRIGMWVLFLIICIAFFVSIKNLRFILRLSPIYALKRK